MTNLVLSDGRIVGNGTMSATLANGQAGITISATPIKSTSITIGTRATATSLTGGATWSAFNPSSGSVGICINSATLGDTMNYMIIP